MARARMLHNKISKSLQVDRLSVPARLLFTWMISWADDEGRLKGEPKYIKGMVVPLTNWSLKNIQKYIESMRDEGLIHYWQLNSDWFIEFVKWNDHQSIRKDRFTSSVLPSNSKKNDNRNATIEQPDGNQPAPQANINESSSAQSNSSKISEIDRVADNNSTKSSETATDIRRSIHPKDFVPVTEGEQIALETWRRLEPNNPFAFYPTYLSAYRKGLPFSLFGQFASEIEQDETVREKGKVFNKKVADFLLRRGVK